MPYCIDFPAKRKFDKPVSSIVGWIADCESCQGVSFRIDDELVPYAEIDRPDVRHAYPGHQVLGFSIRLDFLSKRPTNHLLVLEAIRRSKLLLSERFTIDSHLQTSCAQFITTKEVKREWCLQHIQCPSCTSADVQVSDRNIACYCCDAVFPQKGSSLNLLTPELYKRYSLRPTENISGHPYDLDALKLIERVAARGGKILDCGAGDRVSPNETVINLEIVDYASTDVLGVGQALPFRDGVFDGIFSLSVLEHVSDPFKCAAEMVRVLKSGGWIYTCVPFLQPEHGYPNHFYNMTRQGVLNLFEGLNVERQWVPHSGAPIWALHWIADEYAKHLSPAVRESFLSMTIRDLLAKQPVDYLSEPIVSSLDEEGNWVIACTTAMILSKPKS